MLDLYEKVSKYSVISFDIFDTLLYRKVSKIEELFEKIEKKIKERNMIVEDFCFKRKNAEIEAKKKYGYYYTIEDIYQQLNIEENIKKEILKLELEEEYINCFPNYTIKLLYKKLKKLNKKIIFTTDMYLPKEQIEKMILKCGYEKEKIFLSCEIKKSKRDKSIYFYILNNLKLNKNDIIHVGDAKRSDYLNSKLCGIRSILIKPKCREEIKIYNYIIELKENQNRYYQYGLRIFAPVFLGFCGWLHQEFENNDIKKVFFFTREGEFFLKLYKILYPNNDMKLLYISRKAIVSANVKSMLQEVNKENFNRIFSLKLTETIEEFFKRINLEYSDYHKKAIKYNLNKEMLIRENKENFVDFILNIKESLENQTEKYEKNLLKYLLQENFNGRVAIVDIGWAGSIQYNLEKFCIKNNISININGFYLGVDNTFAMNKKGYLYSPENLYLKNKILSFSGLLEIVTMPNFGSTLYYENFENKVVPKLDKNEFGKEYEKINNIQIGVIDFFESYLKEKNKYQFNYKFKSLNKNFLAFGLRPLKKEILDFSKLNFYDNNSTQKIISLDKFWSLFNSESRQKIKQNFLESKWKSAYLINLFKLRIDYSEIIGFFRNFK